MLFRSVSQSRYYPINHQLLQIKQHLILLNHTTKNNHFNYIEQTLEFILEKPILQYPQLNKIILTTAINQNILINPTHTNNIQPKNNNNTLKQAFLHLIKILQHPQLNKIILTTAINQNIPNQTIQRDP